MAELIKYRVFLGEAESYLDNEKNKFEVIY